eukprot:CAMPEP_0197177444 /NCGR_PEP_ID=MMETSP1423-20130617/3042_1 /TAXON_ID=476441 /ORGANISM="Pseudo-nitzschia heimii, Strain UNC1101" /LENGTH=508 /DNA_ID=CAMNT_0042626985 /DNA_START=455 /DNA_END=1981 /DNA_ORIENTATION=+
MILVNNSTKALVIRGGQLAGSRLVSVSQQHQGLRASCNCNLRSNHSSSTSIATVLRDQLSKNTSLVSLKVSGLEFSITENNGNKNEGSFSGLAYNKTLRRLDLSGSNLSSTVNSLSDALCKNTTLQYIRLCQSSLDDQSLARLVRSVKRHPCLTTLNLSKNYLGARNNSSTVSSTTVALDAIAELLQSNESILEYLDLSHQYQQHPPSITTTNNSNLSLKKKMAAEEQEQYKAAFGRSLEALSTNTSLRKIDFSGNFGCLQDDSSIRTLGFCLQCNESLEYINVSGCGINPRNMAYLGREHFPWFGPSLKEFILFGSSETIAISPPTITTIQESQQQRQRLGCPYTLEQNFKRRDNHRESECEQCHNQVIASALEEGLLSNMTLENLGDIESLYKNSENNIVNDGGNTALQRSCRIIQQTLNLNKGGRRAMMENDSDESQLPVGIWSHLLARAGNLNYVYNTSTNEKGRRLQGNQAQYENKSDGQKSCSSASSVLFALLRQGPVLLEH